MWKILKIAFSKIARFKQKWHNYIASSFAMNSINLDITSYYMTHIIWIILLSHIRWYHHLWFMNYLIHSLRISSYENLRVWDCWIFDLEVYSKIFQHEHQMILILFFWFEIVIFDFDLDEPNDVYHVSHLLNLKIITDYLRFSILYETIIVQMFRK